jgi:DNA-directed RNA polymerase subunit M/transcription elongation factor TFIIS
MRFCPLCSYYLYLSTKPNVDGTKEVILKCRHCSHSEQLKPSTAKEALILETKFAANAESSETGSIINSYTMKDPTLPHVKNIPCPNTGCPTVENPEIRDVIYIRTDPVNMKFQYVCVPCGTQWRS